MNWMTKGLMSMMKWCLFINCNEWFRLTQSGLTPLHVASFMGCMNIVIFLLQHGANANAPTMRGEAPLHLASRANQTDIVRILLRNNAEVDARARVSSFPVLSSFLSFSLSFNFRSFCLPFFPLFFLSIYLSFFLSLRRRTP